MWKDIDKNDKHWNECEQKFKFGYIVMKKHWRWQEWQTLKLMWTKILVCDSCEKTLTLTS